MIRLLPNTIYSLIYKDGLTLSFKTLERVPEAKHLIKVILVSTGKEVELMSLLLKPWVDIVRLQHA